MCICAEFVGKSIWLSVWECKSMGKLTLNALLTFVLLVNHSVAWWGSLKEGLLNDTKLRIEYDITQNDEIQRSQR